MADHDGLGVGRIDLAGVGGVADVTDGTTGAGEPLQLGGRKDLGNQSLVFVEHQAAVDTGGDAAGVLPPVLKGVHGVVGVKGRVPGTGAGTVDEPKDAAFLFHMAVSLLIQLTLAAHLSPIRRRITSWYASSTPPISRRNRSLSSFSWVTSSHRRQVSGLISSARTI